MMKDANIKIIKINAGQSNLYVVNKNNRNLMIDAGNHGLQKIDNVLKSHDIEYKDIELVVLTHTHYDHVNLLYELNKKIYTEILVHKAGEKYLKFGQTPDPKNGNAVGKLLLFFNKIGGNGKFKPVVPDTVINGEYFTDRLGFDVNIIPTPGHTPDSISIIIDNKWAFVGDTLFNILPGTIYPIFVDDKDKLKQSWQTLLNLKCDYYFPGHGTKISHDKFIAAYQKLFG
ncbi:MAG: MBL fold metallo-hydrolase [Fidelibacterota bacterium]